jgi:hypothetical protein
VKPGFFIFIFAIFLLATSGFARAEYRTYKLGVRPKPDVKEKEAVVYSTLDDQQYMTYYSVSGLEYVRIIQHWMCFGRTDQFKKLCGQPPDKKDWPDPLIAAAASAEKKLKVPITAPPGAAPAPVLPRAPASPNNQQPAPTKPANQSPGPAQNLGLR